MINMYIILTGDEGGCNMRKLQGYVGSETNYHRYIEAIEDSVCSKACLGDLSCVGFSSIKLVDNTYKCLLYDSQEQTSTVQKDESSFWKKVCPNGKD